MTEKQLKMSFDPQTIEHLGVKMYSQIPNAIAELIANAYDADAKSVRVKLYDTGSEKRIEVLDDGIGMDFDEINDKFLRIGRNRRQEGATQSPGGRKATGKKGLGKLALFGIGDLIEVATTKKDSNIKVKFTLSWANLKATHDPPPINRSTSRVTTGSIGTIDREDIYGEEALYGGADHRALTAG